MRSCEVDKESLKFMRNRNTYQNLKDAHSLNNSKTSIWVQSVSK